MARTQPAKLLHELHRKTEDLATKSTRLSNLLEKAEEFFRAMPGKVDASVGEGYDTLSLCRTGSSGWRLWYGYTEGEGEGFFVCEAPVHIKVRAALLLPDLYSKVTNSVSDRLADVESALDALERVPFLSENSEDK